MDPIELSNDPRAEAVARLQRGDDSQLDVLRAAVRAHVIRLALNVATNREDAEEILNDVMLKVSVHRAKLDPCWPIARAFILKIAKNEALDRARRLRLLTVPFEEQSDTPAPLQEEEPPHRSRLQKTLSEIAPGVSQHLENRHRRILPVVVRWLEPSLELERVDMDEVYAQAAQELHLAPPSIRNAMSNVGKALKQELQRVSPEAHLRDQDVRLALCLITPLLQSQPTWH